jgi:hypothetical protein
MPKFMLILHSTPGRFQSLSPEEMQRKIQSYQAWIEQVRSSGRYVVSEKLGWEGGKIVEQHKGRATVVDGPYSESKEVVGGFFLLRAENYEEAVAIARECPFLEDGPIVVRQTDPMGCGGD